MVQSVFRGACGLVRELESGSGYLRESGIWGRMCDGVKMPAKPVVVCVGRRAVKVLKSIYINIKIMKSLILLSLASLSGYIAILQHFFSVPYASLASP